ncbi:MAG: hypothetical protein GY790_20875 [Bacteroidetes bacterium]|nr:hypothetical protein [Bacteroidota bacterium]
MKILRILLPLLILFGLQPAFSQEAERGSSNGQPFFQLIYHQGVHWNRTKYLQEPMEDGFKGIEARIGFQTLGGEIWQQYNHYPKYGLGIHYADEIKDRSDTALGNPFSFFAFYNVPLARFGRFTLYTNLSAGLSYVRLIHDPVSNPFNDIVGSHINLYLDLDLNLAVELGQRTDLNLGYGMTHYSNGRIHMPQKGLNNWGWLVGMTYLFGGPDDPFRRAEFIYTEPPEFDPFGEVQLMMSVGVTEWQPDDVDEGVHYFTSSFTADYAYRYKARSAVTLGMDVMYDGSLKNAIKGFPPDDVTTFQKMYMGGHLGYQFTIDKLTFLVNLGTYFLHHSYDRRFYFARAGARIHFTDHLAGHICVKSRNGIRSDWIEWGLVYSIRRR